MTLKAVYATQDEIPEALREHYSEGDADGQWYLDAEGIDSLPHVQGLVRTLDKLKRSLKRSKDDLDRFDALRDLQEEELDRIVAMVDAGELGDDGGQSGGDEGEAKLEQLQKRLEAKHQRELKKLEQRSGALERALKNRTVDHALDSAISEAGFTGTRAKAVKALLKMEHQPEMVEVEGADGPEFKGVFALDKDGVPGQFEIDEMVADWAKTEAAAEFLPASGKSGSGASPDGRGGSSSGGSGTMSRGDVRGWAENAESIAKGEMTLTD